MTGEEFDSMTEEMNELKKVISKRERQIKNLEINEHYLNGQVRVLSDIIHSLCSGG